ncbi:EutN/CcmL family microcompartment protein [Candidatus Neomarinimicrobiota bacterium]
MILGQVTGSVVSTVKDANFIGSKLLLVAPINLDGDATSAPFIAIDRVDAGKGDRVLVCYEGGAAAIALKHKVPAQAVIVAVVDHLNVDYLGD